MSLMRCQWCWVNVRFTFSSSLRVPQRYALTLVANFAAYSFAPPILVTPLGSLSVIIGCVGISLYAAAML
jgi:magnesium transporter NIPA